MNGENDEQREKMMTKKDKRRDRIQKKKKEVLQTMVKNLNK